MPWNRLKKYDYIWQHDYDGVDHGIGTRNKFETILSGKSEMA